MNGLMQISAGVGIVNSILLVILLIVYSRIYKKTRAVFTIGLIFFAGMLMLHNLIAVYAYFAMQPLYATELLPYFAAVNIAELAGIAALFKVTI